MKRYLIVLSLLVVAGTAAQAKEHPGKAYFDRKTGTLLSMDFAPPMATGDTLAGVASAAKTLGIKEYDPVPGWRRSTSEAATS